MYEVFDGKLEFLKMYTGLWGVRGVEGTEPYCEREDMTEGDGEDVKWDALNGEP
jgi:hypothetical protein